MPEISKEDGTSEWYKFHFLSGVMVGMGIELIVGIIGSFIGDKLHIGYVNKIPQAKQVQQGYVNPSKLEIKLKDLDRNGIDEVIMKYGGKPYLLKLDEQGKPQVQDYKVK